MKILSLHCHSYKNYCGPWFCCFLAVDLTTGHPRLWLVLQGFIPFLQSGALRVHFKVAPLPWQVTWSY